MDIGFTTGGNAIRRVMNTTVTVIGILLYAPPFRTTILLEAIAKSTAAEAVPRDAVSEETSTSSDAC